MTTHVFVGPTLSSDEVYARLPEAVVHPPIGHGDPFRLSPSAGDTVAIIDGLFFQSTAVRHKELLWLLQRGVRVVGSSSMGALRAAELDRFGMRGIGQVYRAFAEGQLEADDEVAVVHADAADGWTNYSDALVNLRTAAARAQEDGVLRGDEATAFIEAARSLYFPQRRASQIIRRCGAAGVLEPKTVEVFLTWLRENAWDAKAEDARLLLQELADETPAVRPRDDGDWEIGELPGFVHTWCRDLSPVDEIGTTAGEVEGLLRLFATDGPEVVARIGAAAAARAWALATPSLLAEHCVAMGLTEPIGQLDELIGGNLRPDEQLGKAVGELAALALARLAFGVAGQAETRPAYPPAAIELAIAVNRFNDALAREASHQRPEFIAPATVDRYFAEWWSSDDVGLEARRRGFRDLDDFRTCARRSLAFAASNGVPTLVWEPA